MSEATERSERFDGYLGRLTGVIGHADRHEPLKKYCVGLLLPSETNKSVELLLRQPLRRASPATLCDAPGSIRGMQTPSQALPAQPAGLADQVERQRQQRKRPVASVGQAGLGVEQRGHIRVEP